MLLPTVADILELEPVRRGAPRVLAGADRLDAPVRWVHVIELAQAGHLLRGAELVLSTGIALPPDPQGLARYVAELAEVGASALAVELGSRYVRELPRALVDAASAHRLPLIVLERETQFIAITEAVHTRILQAQVAELRAAQRLRQVFTDLALAGASAQEIVSQAAALAGMPVILEDLAHRVLACAPAGQDTAALLAGYATRSRAVVAPGRTGYDPAAGWLVTQVGTRDVTWGRLIVVLPGPPAPGTEVLAEHAAATIALAGLTGGRGEQESQAAASRRPVRAAHQSVLAALTGPEYADPADLAARIGALGIPLAGHRLLPVVIRPHATPAASAAADAAADAVAAACEEMAVPAIAAALGDGETTALLALPPEREPDDVLAGLAARLPAGPPSRALAIGVGPLVAGVDQARVALAEADQAAGAAARHGWDRPFARLADLRLAGLMYQLRDDPRVLAYAERELGPLLSHDEVAGTDLTGLLSRYLETGGNKAETAQRAGLARPTLYERLRQIEQILGVPLESAASRLALYAALLTLPRPSSPQPLSLPQAG